MSITTIPRTITLTILTILRIREALTMIEHVAILVAVVVFIVVLWYSGKRFRRSRTVETPRLRKLLSEIPSNWDREDFVICGSATLAFRGIRDVHDLDILVRPELLESMRGDLTHRDGSYASSYGDNGLIDIFSKPPRLGSVTFDDVKNEADQFEGFYVQSARHTLAIKALVPILRDKDRPDMVELAKIIAQQRTRKVAGDYRTGFVDASGYTGSY
jgi:hypothetical protein